MDIKLEIWLRGENHATALIVDPVERSTRAWTDADVSSVLTGMLRALERAKNPDAAPGRPIALARLQLDREPLRRTAAW